MYQLSICADTVFLELPFKERAEKISETGFLVKFWGWEGHNLDFITSNNVKVAAFSAAGKGSLLHSDGVDAYAQYAIDTFPIVQKLNCSTLVIHAGELGKDGKAVHDTHENPITRWITAYTELKKLAAFAEANRVTYCLEVLNTKVDHAGYCLNYVEDAVRLIQEVNSPNIRVLMNIYHSQVDEGNVIELIRKYHPLHRTFPCCRCTGTS